LIRLQEKGLKYDPDLLIYHHWLDDVHVSDPGWASFLSSPARRELLRWQGKEQGRPSPPFLRAIISFFLKTEIGKRTMLFAGKMKPYKEKRGISQDAFRVAMEKFPPGLLERHDDFSDQFASGEITDLDRFEAYNKAFVNRGNFLAWAEGVDALSSICRDEDMDCMLLLTPVLHFSKNGDYHWSALHAFIASLAAEFDLDVLDLTDVFRPHGSLALRAKPMDYEHPSGEGNRIIADHIADFLKSRNMLPMNI